MIKSNINHIYKSYDFSSLTNDLIDQRHKLWLNNANHIFSSYFWTKASVNSINKGCRCIVYVCYTDNQLAGVIPIIEHNFLLLKYATFPGGRFLDKGSLLYTEIDVIKGILHIIINKYESIFLNELANEELDLCKKVHIKYNLNGVNSDNYAISLLNTDNNFNFSKKSLKNLKRLINLGNFDLKITHGSEMSIETITSFERISSKFINGRMIFNNNRVIEFFAELLSNKNMFIYELIKDGTTIAIDIGGIVGDKYFSYYGAYNNNYQLLSPGNCLQYLMIDDLRNKNITLYDLLRGFTLQKKNFANIKYNNFYFYATKSIRISIYIKIKLFFIGLVKSIKKTIKKFLN